jgi:hypothetical protein
MSVHLKSTQPMPCITNALVFADVGAGKTARAPLRSLYCYVCDRIQQRVLLCVLIQQLVPADKSGKPPLLSLELNKGEGEKVHTSTFESKLAAAVAPARGSAVASDSEEEEDAEEYQRARVSVAHREGAGTRG